MEQGIRPVRHLLPIAVLFSSNVRSVDGEYGHVRLVKELADHGSDE
jgi:hypothetical protein